MAARRRTVILCASEDGLAWDVCETGLDGMPSAHLTQQAFPEYEVRRDWNGVTLFECLRKRQEDEAAAAERSDAIFASMAVDREASVRTWGINSPYWQELYGHLTMSEWDTLWQGWQREIIEAERHAAAETVRLAEEPV